MAIHLTPATIITAGSVIAALGAIGALIWRVVHWVDRQKAQDRELAETREELSILTYGVLSCLKGLREQGCNGPVTEAINKIEKHMNKQAHRIE